MIFINVRAENQKLFCKLFFVAMLCMSQLAVAAQLDLSVVDDNNSPLKDAVAALVPLQKVDYANANVAIIDQRENMFVPRVLAIRVNTQVRFPNSDDVRHHVYSFSPAKKFELRLYHGKTAEPVLFDKPGTVVLGCNIHDSMVAHIYVVETEHFSVANTQGIISIEAPAGKYQLQIYHPKMTGNFPESTITLNDEQTVNNKITVNNLSAETTSDTADEFSDLF